MEIMNANVSNRNVIQHIFLKFVKALETNDLPSIKGYFTYDAVANFSNLGQFQSTDAIIAGLTFRKPELDVARLKVTNSYVAVADDQAHQSVYLTGVFAMDKKVDELDTFIFGGHFVNTYVRTNEGWKISYLRFQLDWHHGNSNHTWNWKLFNDMDNWNQRKVAPSILSELDAPWRVFPNTTENGTDEEQVAETYIRYAWGLDQADFDLMASAFTEDAKADMSPFGPMDSQREIVSLLKYMRVGQPYMQHAASNFRAVVTGDTATMDIYRVVPFTPSKETIDVPIYGARYESRLRREDGVWKFEWLKYIPGWIRGDENIGEING